MNWIPLCNGLLRKTCCLWAVLRRLHDRHLWPASASLKLYTCLIRSKYFWLARRNKINSIAPYTWRNMGLWFLANSRFLEHNERKLVQNWWKWDYVDALNKRRGLLLLLLRLEWYWTSCRITDVHDMAIKWIYKLALQRRINEFAICGHPNRQSSLTYNTLLRKLRECF